MVALGIRRGERSPVGALALALALVAGCSALERHPVPVDRIPEARLPGYEGVRAWADEPSRRVRADLTHSIEQEGDRFVAADGSREYAALAISGGGADGAFTAGFVKGWTATGSRPTFKIVTGVSTGALIAPFVFVGEEWDDELELAYTTTATRDVMRIRRTARPLRYDSLARSTPLAELIGRWVDQGMFDAIAREHRAGRRLYVVSANLDAQRPVAWNLGAIAASGQPGAIELLRRALLASASIPVAFEPVFFEVEVDGQRYDEMHVDGGTIMNFFFLEAMADLVEVAKEAGIALPAGTLYLILNNEEGPRPEAVERKLLPVAQRALGTAIKSGNLSGLFRIWAQSQRDQIELRWLGIPPDTEIDSNEAFDPVAMRQLFEVGFALAQEENPWHSRRAPKESESQ